MPRWKYLERGNSNLICAPPTRERYLESATVGQSSRAVQTKLGYGYVNMPTTNNFLGNKTLPRNLCSPTGHFSGRTFSIRRSGNGTKKTMDMPKVFGIDRYDVAKAHRSSCSTHSVRLSGPINDGLLGAKRKKSVMEGLEDPLLELKAPVRGVNNSQYCKGKRWKRVLKQSMQGSKDYWSHHRGEFSMPSPNQGPTTYKDYMCPSVLELHHPSALKLPNFATMDFPTMTGKPWILIQMEKVIYWGPHVSALQPVAIKILAEEVAE